MLIWPVDSSSANNFGYVGCFFFFLDLIGLRKWFPSLNFRSFNALKSASCLISFSGAWRPNWNEVLILIASLHASYRFLILSNCITCIRFQSIYYLCFHVFPKNNIVVIISEMHRQFWSNVELQSIPFIHSMNEVSCSKHTKTGNSACKKYSVLSKRKECDEG